MHSERGRPQVVKVATQRETQGRALVPDLNNLARAQPREPKLRPGSLERRGPSTPGLILLNRRGNEQLVTSPQPLFVKLIGPCTLAKWLCCKYEKRRRAIGEDFCTARTKAPTPKTV